MRRSCHVVLLVLVISMLMCAEAWILYNNLVKRNLIQRPLRLSGRQKKENSNSDLESFHQNNEAASNEPEGININELSPESINSTIAIDPKQAAIKEVETKLQGELHNLEETLRSKRISLNKAKNKVLESGPRGYYLIQAQVNEYLRSKAAEEAKLLEKSKKEFVLKVIPLIDKFRLVPSQYPATTPAEQEIHDNYKLICLGFELAVKKYGYTEFTPAVGDKLDSHYHQVIGTEESDKEGIVVRCDRSGWNHPSDREVIRKAQVIVTKLKKVEQSEGNEKEKENGKEKETVKEDEAIEDKETVQQ